MPARRDQRVLHSGAPLLDDATLAAVVRAAHRHRLPSASMPRVKVKPAAPTRPVRHPVHAVDRVIA